MYRGEKNNFTFSFFVRIYILFMFITLPALSWAQIPSPYWTGDGKKGMSLAILVPDSQSLSKDFAYLPAMIQGCLVSNLSKYSAISVLDRVALDKVIAETLDPTYKDNFDIVRLGHIAQTGYIMTGNVIKTFSGYTMQINVTDTTPNSRTLASFSGSFTVAQLDDQSAIQKASLDLLTQMGVMLTDKAKQELNTINTRESINAQTALAQGITAQKQGTEITALSYYFQAATLDPVLSEATNRASIMSADISSGNIGENVRNDIQWRKAWVDRLTETEHFFDNFLKTASLPYTLFYSTEIKQGEINYQTETTTLSIETRLHGSQLWGNPLGRVMWTVYNGLKSTKRANDWGLGRWPDETLTNFKTFSNYRTTFTINVELVNSRNKVIGSQTFQTQGTWGFIPEPFVDALTAPIFYVSHDDQKTVSFTNVKASDITDSLTIRIVQVNGIEAQTVARNGVLQIVAISVDKWDFYNSFEIDKRDIIKYNGKESELIIETIWGETILTIQDRAFFSKQLTSVVIPNTVIVIRPSAFKGNRLTSITIPANVELGNSYDDSFDYRFDEAYNKNNKQAGTYVLNGRTWTRK
jgi:hypothetical protein